MTFSIFVLRLCLLPRIILLRLWRFIFLSSSALVFANLEFGLFATTPAQLLPVCPTTGALATWSLLTTLAPVPEATLLSWVPAPGSMTLQFPAVVFDDNGAPKYSYDRARATSSVLTCVNIMPSLKDKTLVSDSDLQELGYHTHTSTVEVFISLYRSKWLNCSFTASWSALISSCF